MTDDAREYVIRIVDQVHNLQAFLMNMFLQRYFKLKSFTSSIQQIKQSSTSKSLFCCCLEILFIHGEAGSVELSQPIRRRVTFADCAKVENQLRRNHYYKNWSLNMCNSFPSFECVSSFECRNNFICRHFAGKLLHEEWEICDQITCSSETFV